ncbi:MAG TPA: hypothetical protein DCY79_12760 [Planctomycetaceae bacterium]|nr:hypothetical protein [Blastopirellula sp.]HAY80670.1 hypothetical protein [Planctomycetaceae bacterium]
MNPVHFGPSPLEMLYEQLSTSARLTSELIQKERGVRLSVGSPCDARPAESSDSVEFFSNALSLVDAVDIANSA